MSVWRDRPAVSRDTRPWATEFSDTPLCAFLVRLVALGFCLLLGYLWVA